MEDGVRQMAVKVCRMDCSAADLRMLWKEIELIASCHDRNCLQFYGVALPEVHLICPFRSHQLYVIDREAEDFRLDS